MRGSGIFLLLVTMDGGGDAASGQTVAPGVGSATSGAQSAASMADFSGIWAHRYLPGFEPPAAGPGPVLNRSRAPNGRAKGLDPPAKGALMAQIAIRSLEP